MLKPLLRAVLLASLLFAVSACGEKTPEQAAAPAAQASTPDGAILRSAQLLKNDDIQGLIRHAMPPADYERTRAEWTRDVNSTPVTDEDRQKFAETMQKLTAPGAEEALFAEIEPQLRAFDAEYQQQMPMYVAMGTGWLQGMVQESKDLSPEARQQAIAAIAAMGEWVRKTRFTDPASVKQIIAILVRAAREVDVHTLEQARALGFEQSVDKMRITVRALKDALAVYGLSVDRTLESVKAEALSNDGNTAKVLVSYTLFDTPLTGEMEMVNVDGRWYDKDTIDKLRAQAAESSGDEAGPDDAGAEPQPPGEGD
ncbi:MAG: hypothetical protein J0H15_12055 [Xanthomonadales bacterium]|nr:hypothetical protein [Xanthomonadales bacterium]